VASAVGAAAMDAFVDKHPHKDSKRHFAESAITGLVLNRLAGGEEALGVWVVDEP
jgi:hypothetical protein